MGVDLTDKVIYLDRKHGVGFGARRFIVPIEDLTNKIVTCVAWRENDGVPSFTSIASARLTSSSNYKAVDVNDL